MSRAEKPNIVFILSDDQGPWAAGCYGNDEIRTPAIDRIAETGMRFDNVFVATPVCSPSRATFLTGGFRHNTVCTTGYARAMWVKTPPLI